MTQRLLPLATVVASVLLVWSHGPSEAPPASPTGEAEPTEGKIWPTTFTSAILRAARRASMRRRLNFQLAPPARAVQSPPGVGVSLCRRSVPAEFNDSKTLESQQRQNDSRCRELGISRYRDRAVNFHIIEDDVSGKDVFKRDAIRYLVDLIQHAEITHLFVFQINRLMRSSASEALQLVGCMVDHRVTVVTSTHVLRTWVPSDRRLVLDELFVAEADNLRKSETIQKNQLELFRQGYYPSGNTPFATRLVARGAHTVLQLRPGAARILRKIYSASAMVDGTRTALRQFVAYCNKNCQAPWTGSYTASRLYMILEDPTYDGHHVRWAHGNRRARAGIVATFRVPGLQVHGLNRMAAKRALSKWKGARMNYAERNSPPVLDLQTLLDISHVNLLELIPDQNVIVICRRPKCRRQALDLVENDQPAAVRNGGRRVRGQWLQLYRCEICKRSFFAIPRRLLRLMTKGCRCMRCNNLNTFKATVEEGVATRQLLFRVKCTKCGAEVLLEDTQWNRIEPFSKIFSEVKRTFTRLKPNPRCIHRNRIECAGRCAKAARLMESGLPSTQAAVNVGLPRSAGFRLRNKLNMAGLHSLRRFSHARARNLHAAGATDSVIAEDQRVSLKVVRTWRRANRLEPNARPGSFDVKKVLSMHHHGKTPTEIGCSVGADPKSVAQHLRRHGIVPHLSRRRVPDALALKLYWKGATDSGIGQKLRFTREAIQHWRTRRGLESNRKKKDRRGRG